MIDFVGTTTTLRNYFAISSCRCSPETTESTLVLAMQTQQNFLILTATVGIRKWAAYTTAYAGRGPVRPLGYFYISQVGQSGQSENNSPSLRRQIAR